MFVLVSGVLVSVNQSADLRLRLICEGSTVTVTL